MLVARWERDAQSLAFLLNNLVGKSGMAVGPLQDGGDAKTLGGLQCANGAHRPGMDNVNLSNELFEPT